MHSVTDGQRDRRHYHANKYGIQNDRLKTKQDVESDNEFYILAIII